MDNIKLNLKNTESMSLDIEILNQYPEKTFRQMLNGEFIYEKGGNKILTGNLQIVKEPKGDKYFSNIIFTDSAKMLEEYREIDKSTKKEKLFTNLHNQTNIILIQITSL